MTFRHAPLGLALPANAIEAAYLEALGGVSDWSMEADGRLLLDGVVPLRYAPR